MAEQEKPKDPLDLGPTQQVETLRREDGTFAPGFSGNPKGRPRISLAKIIREELNKYPEGQQRTYLGVIIRILLKKGIKDEDVLAIRELLDRGYGKAVQVMDFGGDEDIREVNVKIIRSNENQPPQT